jgi:hypothetical protein
VLNGFRINILYVHSIFQVQYLTQQVSSGGGDNKAGHGHKDAPPPLSPRHSVEVRTSAQSSPSLHRAVHAAVGNVVGRERSPNSSPTPLAHAAVTSVVKPALSKSPRLTIASDGSIPIKLTCSPDRDRDMSSTAQASFVMDNVGAVRKVESGGVRKAVRYNSPSSSSSLSSATASPDSRPLLANYSSSGAGELTVIKVEPRDTHRVAPVGAVAGERPSVEGAPGGVGARVTMSPGVGGGSGSGGTPVGNKVPVQVTHSHSTTPAGSQSPRKTSAARGIPPPIPPNKPLLSSPVPGASTKPALPPKVGVSVSKDRMMGGGSVGVEMGPAGDAPGQGKAIQIPINVVHGGGGGQSGGARPSPRDNSPGTVRKTAQVCVNAK